MTYASCNLLLDRLIRAVRHELSMASTFQLPGSWTGARCVAHVRLPMAT